MKRTVIFAGILVMFLGFITLASAQTKTVRIKKEHRIRKDEKNEKYFNLESDKSQSNGNKKNTDKTSGNIASDQKQIPHRKENQLCRQIYNIYSAIGF
jgi:hypothetical protein